MLYNVVLLSAKQHRKSVVKYTYILLVLSLLPTPKTFLRMISKARILEFPEFQHQKKKKKKKKKGKLMGWFF